MTDRTKTKVGLVLLLVSVLGFVWYSTEAVFPILFGGKSGKVPDTIVKQEQHLAQFKSAISNEPLLTDQVAIELSRKFDIAIYPPPKQIPVLPKPAEKDQDMANRLRVQEKEIEILRQKLEHFAAVPPLSAKDVWWVSLWWWLLATISSHLIKWFLDRWLLPHK